MRPGDAAADLDHSLSRHSHGNAPAAPARGDADHAGPHVPVPPGARRRIQAHAAGPRQPHVFPPAAAPLAKSRRHRRPAFHPQRGPRRADLPGYVRPGLEMSAAVEVRELSYRYPPRGRLALEAVSFSVAEDECIAILGPNGAGKSTLMLHLNGLLPEQPPAEPRIWIGGEPLVAKTLDQVRQRVGLLFQDPDDQLISATVFEDVAFGPQQLGTNGAELRLLVADSL